MTAQGNVPHDDFKSGFIVGYRAIVGTAPTLPPIPNEPPIVEGFTAFLMGVRKGVVDAGGSVRG